MKEAHWFFRKFGKETVEGCVAPYGFSYLWVNSLGKYVYLFRMILPFRWKAYSFYRQEEAWGNAHFYFVSKKINGEKEDSSLGGWKIDKK